MNLTDKKRKNEIDPIANIIVKDESDGDTSIPLTRNKRLRGNRKYEEGKYFEKELSDLERSYSPTTEEDEEEEV